MPRESDAARPPSGVGGSTPPWPGHDLGAWGETIAAHRLAADGWTVVERNLTWGRREIDLVVRRGTLLAFVEVKTRSEAGYGGPQAAVGWKKQREIEAVAQAYLATRVREDLDVRFDVVAIVGRRGTVLSYTHIEDAWRPHG